MVIAIDGPAGAGKSTVARAVARELGFVYLNSGALYRCVALLALASPGERPAALARAARIELGTRLAPDAVAAGANAAGADAAAAGTRLAHDTDAAGADAAAAGDGDGRVLLDGRDVTAEIRTPEVSEAASRVASDPGVREALVAIQRELIAAGSWVVEGRDIGTVVAPDAALKIYLTADPRERARRRAAQLGIDVDTVLAEQTMRDERDSTRAYSPLRPAPGAVMLDTTGLGLDEVVERIAVLTRECAARP
jgi:cytidylate kinase